MSYEEMLGWFNYFKRRPIGWREDYRAALIIKSFGSNTDMDKLFPSLAAIGNKQNSSNPLISSLKASLFGSKINNSVGGKRFDI